MRLHRVLPHLIFRRGLDDHLQEGAALVSAPPQRVDRARDAVVILNFHRAGDASERESMGEYGDAMFDLMAESGNGPVHLGSGVTVEGDAIFDHVVMVYCPGVDYLAGLVQSKYFIGIVGGKRLGDAMGVLSVPLLPHL